MAYERGEISPRRYVHCSHNQTPQPWELYVDDSLSPDQLMILIRTYNTRRMEAIKWVVGGAIRRDNETSNTNLIAD